MPVVLLDAKTEADLAKYKGKLGGYCPAGTPAQPCRQVRAHGRAAHRLQAARGWPTRRNRFGVVPPASHPASPPTNGEPQTATTVAAATTGGWSASVPPLPRHRYRAGEPSTVTRVTAIQLGFSFTRRRLRSHEDAGAVLLADPSTAGDGGTLFVYSASLPAAESSSGGGRAAPGGNRTSVCDKRPPRRFRRWSSPPSTTTAWSGCLPPSVIRSRWRSTWRSSSMTTT